MTFTSIAAAVVAAVIGGLLLAGILAAIAGIIRVLRMLEAVSHEVHLNNGSSLKDAVIQLQVGHRETTKTLKRIERRQREAKVALAA